MANHAEPKYCTRFTNAHQVALVDETPTSANYIPDGNSNDNGDSGSNHGNRVHINCHENIESVSENGKHKALSPLLLTGLMYTLTTSGAYGIE